METEFFSQLNQAIQDGKTGVLAIIVDAEGSTPRDAGTKMTVFSDGSILHTIGGGALEKHVIELAKEVMKAQQPRLIAINLKHDLGMECGGSVKIYLEPLPKPKRLIIFGGGHIGKALYQLAPLLNMLPVIIDERVEFSSAERFPKALLITALPAVAVKKLNLNENDFIVIVTHQHTYDYEALKAVLPYNIGYIGMIGSKKKVALTFEKLREEGFSEEKIKEIHSPIGLNLGGRTPGEIAIAIAAEIIAIQYNIESISKKLNY